MKRRIPLMGDRYTVTALARAVDVLERLARHPDGMRLAELTRETGIPKSTLFRILSTLEKRQCISLDEERGRYRLGLKLAELGNAFLGQSDLHNAAVRPMRKLAEAYEESVFLSVLDEETVVYVRRMESPQSAVVVRKLGQRAPVYCTATGLAMLAFLPGDEVERILSKQEMQAFTPRTTTDPATVRQKLEQVRREGVAVVDGEYNPALLCVSSPILNEMGRPTAALTLAVLSAQANEEQVADMRRRIRQAARELSAEQGYLESQAVESNPRSKPNGQHA